MVKNSWNFEVSEKENFIWKNTHNFFKTLKPSNLASWCERRVYTTRLNNFWNSVLDSNTFKLGDKEQLDKEQIGVKEPFPVTNLPFTS